MRGSDLKKRVLNLLGYSGNAGSPSSAALMEKRCLEAVNQIMADLKGESISSLSEELTISAAKTQALCYGTAMMLSLTEGDGEKNRLFTDLYNSKRAAALACIEHVGDCLPNAGTEQAI